MAHPVSWGIPALLGASALFASAALAQEYPQFYAQRCQVAELQGNAVAQDPCRPAFAVLGLLGPTVLPHGAMDVVATASTGSRTAPRR